MEPGASTILGFIAAIVLTSLLYIKVLPKKLYLEEVLKAPVEKTEIPEEKSHGTGESWFHGFLFCGIILLL